MTDQPATKTDPSPREWQEHWQKELELAHREVKKWHEDGADIVKKYRADVESNANPHRLNLFTVNVQTQESILKGRIPRVSVERRHADAADDGARVAGEMLERLLNSDIERSGDTYDSALKHSLKDRLLPGLGQVRIRYVARFEDVPERPAVNGAGGAVLSPPVPASRKKSYECVHTDYLHWRDFRWKPSRTWDEVVERGWVAFGNDMSQEALESRFGKDVAGGVPLSSPTGKEREDGKKDPLDRARVWEIWDAAARKVFWVAEGASLVLDTEDDPLRLTRFFPCPKPFVGLTTTDTFLPTPDYELHRSLYERVDRLGQRIALLEEAIDVKGVFDGSNPAIQRLLGDVKGKDRLIPVDNWAMLGEKGGLKGAVDWFPLDQVVNALVVLGQQLQQAKNDLYEATGLSDIMRGQGEGPGVTLGEQQLKARFSSVRLQATQEDFAAFASEVQALKAEAIANLYDTESILKYANAEFMVDRDKAVEAAELIKDKYAYLRVTVKSEAMSMQDFAELRSEGAEVLQSMTALFQAAAPLVQLAPGSMKHVLRLGQWFLSRLRGASEAEGIFDDAIQEAEAMAAQPQGQQQPDPKLIAQQMKGQQEKEKRQEELQADMVRIAAETQAKGQQEVQQREQNVLEAMQKQILANALRPKQDPGDVTGGGGMTR